MFSHNRLNEYDSNNEVFFSVYVEVYFFNEFIHPVICLDISSIFSFKDIKLFKLICFKSFNILIKILIFSKFFLHFFKLFILFSS